MRNLKRAEEERDILKKAARFCSGTRVKYRFINDHRQQYKTMSLRRVLGVSRGGFYKWLGKPLSDRAIEDQRLLGLIRASYAASGGMYGTPRDFLNLREVGETCGHNRVARIMRANKIKALRGH